MKTKSMLILIGVVLIIVLSTGNFGQSRLSNVGSSESNIILDTFKVLPEAPPEEIIESTIPINVVFIGFNQTNLNISHIDHQLTKSYIPTILAEDYSELPANYSFDVNYFFSNDTLEINYVNYLETHGSTASPPQEFLNKYDDTAIQANYYDAELSFMWLSNHINSYFPGINQTYTLYLIDTFTQSYIQNYYFYQINFPDYDTGQTVGENLTIAWGGTERGFFLDLSAGPIFYKENYRSESNEGVSNSTIPPIWTYSFPEDKMKFNQNISEYIEESIDLLFSASYAYRPIFQQKLLIKVILFQDTTHYDLTSRINFDHIVASLQELLPFSDITISYQTDSIYNAKNTELLNIINNNQTDIDGQTIVDTELIRNYLIQHCDDFSVEEGELPVYIFSWDDPNLWMNDPYVVGRTWDDRKNQSEMIIMGYDPTLYPDYGYTQTTIHEIGHYLGLRHPHDGISYQYLHTYSKLEFQDWLRDFTSTPMTYAHGDTGFSVFDKDQINRGNSLIELRNSFSNYYEGNLSLIAKDFNSENITIAFNDQYDQLLTFLTWTSRNISMAISNFLSMKYNESLDLSIQANYASKHYMQLAKEIVIIHPTEGSTITVTDTKNNTLTETTTHIVTITETVKNQFTASESANLPNLWHTFILIPIFNRWRINRNQTRQKQKIE